MEVVAGHNLPGEADPVEMTLNRAQFQNFLARQNKRQTRKNKNAARLRAEATPSHQPALCKRSLKLASKTTSGDFMTRLAKDALKKEHENLRKKAMLAKSPTAHLRRTF